MSTTRYRLFAVGMLAAAIALAGCGDEKSVPRARKTEKTEGGTAGKTEDGGSGKTAATEGWGDLKGRFVLEGKPPELAPINVSQDAAYCGPFKENGRLRNETIVVGSKNGLKNVVVYLRSKPSRIHDDYKKTEAAEVVLDNHECRFEPHVCLLRTSQTLRIKSSDPMQHNTKFESLNQSFNVLIPPKSSDETKQLTLSENVPTPCGCNIHPWMKGILVIRDNPYMAVSGDDGSFEIKNLPAGDWDFQFWHESVGYLEIGEWTKGKAKLAIEAGKPRDLAEVIVPVEKLKAQ